jgi:hypothetical protein
MATDQENTGLSFRIRPLPPKGQEPPPEPPSPPGEPPTPAEAELTHTAGRFRSSQAVLAFLGAVAGAGLASEARAWRGPQGQWWTEVAVSWRQAAALVESAGGIPYAGNAGIWIAAPADGTAPVAPRRRSKPKKGEILLLSGGQEERLQPGDWVEADLRDLIAAAPLRPVVLTTLDEVIVITLGVLARDIVRRALLFGCTVELTPVTRQPLQGEGPTVGAILLRIRWRRERLPQAFLQSLLRLPATAVTRALGIDPRLPAETGREGEAGLLVDIRYQPPLSSTLVAALVPADQRWLLGGPEVGHWRVDVVGEAIDGATLLAVPPVAEMPLMVTAEAAGPLAAVLPVRLAPRQPAPGYPDAVLLDDSELGWLQTFLIGKPAAETAFLILGPGRHLLLAPGGLLSAVPFGLPLRRVGPGGLYIEEGQDFSPPLPEAARARAFPCRENEAVVVSRAGPTGEIQAQRYALEQVLPVWTLWLGEAPPVAEGVSGAEARRVRQLAQALQAAEPEAEGKKPGFFDKVFRRHKPSDRERLLRQALLAEQRGELLQAAELLEQAEEFATAGRLYERAAEGG